MYIEYILDIIERLDGAGLTIEDMTLVEEELEALGLCHDDDPDCEDLDYDATDIDISDLDVGDSEDVTDDEDVD
jgi:hypothetical protein